VCTSHRTNDAFAERAWQQLNESSESRKKYDSTYLFAKKKATFIQLALGSLALKAWDARVLAFQKSSQPLTEPAFVGHCRKLLAEKRCRTQSAATDSSLSPSALLDQSFGGQMASQFTLLDSHALGMSQAFDQSILPGMLPNDLAPTGWDFWNDMMQAGDSMRRIDAAPLSYNWN
jgi:hypothetical protein